METNVEDIANAVRDLSIAGDVPQDHGRKPLNSERNHLFLQDIFQTLDLATNTITSQAQNIKSVVDNASSSAGLPMTGVCFLHESVKKLTVLTTHLDTIIDTLNEATERSVIRHLKSLGNQKAAIRS
jgi:glutamine synthetase type III